jgi:hypothetical protein
MQVVNKAATLIALSAKLAMPSAAPDITANSVKHHSTPCTKLLMPITRRGLITLHLKP